MKKPQPRHRMSSTRRAERGVALVFVIFATAALLVAISGALVTGSANSRATANYKGASQINFVAESGISHAVQNINATGTTHFKNQIVDDWENRFGTAQKNFAALSGFRYSVAVEENAANPSQRGRIVSTALGPDGYRNTVVAEIVRTNNLSTAPGAVYLATDSDVTTTFQGNNFMIDGNDHDYNGGFGPGAPVPGLSTRNQTNTTQVSTTLNNTQKNNVTGLGFQASPLVPSVMTSAWAPSIDQMNQYVDDLLDLGYVTTPTGNITGNVSLGTISPAAPQLSYSPGSVVVKGAGTVEGSGVWIIDGDLEIQGTLEYAGLIIVRGQTLVSQDPGATIIGNATLYGSLWSQDVKFAAGGSSIVYYSTNALALANMVAGGQALPTTIAVAHLANCAAVPAGASGCPN